MHPAAHFCRLEKAHDGVQRERHAGVAIDDGKIQRVELQAEPLARRPPKNAQVGTEHEGLVVIVVVVLAHRISPDGISVGIVGIERIRIGEIKPVDGPVLVVDEEHEIADESESQAEGDAHVQEQASGEFVVTVIDAVLASGSVQRSLDHGADAHVGSYRFHEVKRPAHRGTLGIVPAGDQGARLDVERLPGDVARHGRRRENEDGKESDQLSHTIKFTIAKALSGDFF